METASSSSGKCSEPPSDQGGKCSKPPSNLKVTKEVLQSETALLALYDKWFLEVKPAQTEEAKKKRFPYFKDACEMIVKLNQEHPEGMFGLGSMANISHQEIVGVYSDSDSE